jgi:hypothetical protein
MLPRVAKTISCLALAHLSCGYGINPLSSGAVCVAQAIVEAALSIVWKLASGCPANCQKFEALDAVGQAAGEDKTDQCISELILTAMGVHSEGEPTLQEQACLAVTALAEGSVRRKPSVAPSYVRCCRSCQFETRILFSLLRGVLGSVRYRRRSQQRCATAESF